MKSTTTVSEDDFSYVTDFSKHGDINKLLAKEIGPKFEEYRSKWDLAHNKKLETDYPLYLSLETQLKCNYKCTMCTFGHEGEIEKQFYPETMSDEIYNKIMAESAQNYCPSIGMNVLNEPLLDRNMVERVNHAHNSGFIDIRMNTNASVLTAEKAAGLIDSGLTRLYVGLDAATEETYSNVRRGGNYNKVLKNIDQFLKIRKEKKSVFPILRVSFVKTGLNEHEIPAFIEYWKDRADMVSIQEYLSPILGAQEEHLKAKTKIITQSYSCPQPWERMIIKGNGIVNPCCAQFNYKLPMGSVANNSIKDIWNNTSFKTLRSQMKDGTWDQNETCYKCITSNYTAE